MKIALVCAALLGACSEGRYRCTTDEQCDLGEGGRCELDGNCTAFDGNCRLERSYSEYAGELSNQCFDHRVAPHNPCVGGQPPAERTGCFAEVCERLPACCDIGWSDACVQVMQQLPCGPHCSTRIALDASRNNTRTQLWELTWSGDAFAALRRLDAAPPFMWVAPGRDELEPRLVTGRAGGFIVGDQVFERAPERAYQSFTSVDLDRDGRDTLVLTYALAGGHFTEILKMDTGETREAQAKASQHLVWGTLDGDGYPDGLAKQGANYMFFDNEDGTEHRREIVNQTMGTLSGGATTGIPAVLRIDFADLDRDGALDFVVLGNSVRIHRASSALGDTPDFDLDCDPPNPARPCAPATNNTIAFGGAALPALDDPGIVIAGSAARNLHLARIVDDKVVVEAMTFGAPCPTCAPIVAAAVRDFDGDRALDVLAIDAELRLYVGLAATGHVFGPATPLAPGETFNTIDLSIAGVPTP